MHACTLLVAERSPVAAAPPRRLSSTYSLMEASVRSLTWVHSGVIKWALCSSRTTKSLGNCRDAACRKTLDPVSGLSAQEQNETR